MIVLGATLAFTLIFLAVSAQTAHAGVIDAIVNAAKSGANKIKDAVSSVFTSDSDDSTVKNAKDFLTKYEVSGMLQFSGGPLALLHTFGWWIVRVVYMLVSTVEETVTGDNLFSLFSFMDGKSSFIHPLYADAMRFAVGAVLVLSLVLVGYKLMFGKTGDMKNLGVNIALTVAMLVMIPTLFGLGKTQFSGENFARALHDDGKSATNIASNGVDKTNSITWNFIKSNTMDWVIVGGNDGWDDVKNSIDKGKKMPEINTMKEKDFKAGIYDLGAIITPSMAKKMGDDDKNKSAEKMKYLQYTLTTADNGDIVASKIDNSWSFLPKGFKSGYYRYTLTSFIGVIVGLGAIGFAMLYNAFVIIKAIIELAVKRIVSVVIIASDIETLQKSKMVLTDIMKCYLTIGLTELNISLFNLFITFVNTKNFNIVLKVMCYFAAVAFVVQGSQSILRYFGVDVGLQEGKSGVGSIMQAATAGFAGGKAAAGSVGSKIGAVGAGAGAVMDSFKNAGDSKLSNKAEAGNGNGNGEGNGGAGANGAGNGNGYQGKHANAVKLGSKIGGGARSAVNGVKSAPHNIKEAAKKTLSKGAAMAGYAGARGISGLAQDAGNKVKEASVAAVQAPGKAATHLKDKAKAEKQEFSNALNSGLAQGQQKAAFNEAKNENQGRPLDEETPPSERNQDQTEDKLLQKQSEEEREALLQNQDEYEKPNEEVNTGDQETASSVQEQQSDQKQESNLESAKANEQKTPQEPQEAVEQQPSQQRQAETPKETPRTETPQEITQVQTEAGTHDYSQIINGGSGSPVTTGSQPTVQKSQSVQPTETKQSTVQKQKRPETPLTKSDGNVLNNPWGDIQNDRTNDGKKQK